MPCTPFEAASWVNSSLRSRCSDRPSVQSPISLLRTQIAACAISSAIGSSRAPAFTEASDARDLARQDFEQALQLSPEAPAARFNRALLALREARFALLSGDGATAARTRSSAIGDLEAAARNLDPKHVLRAVVQRLLQELSG